MKHFPWTLAIALTVATPVVCSAAPGAKKSAGRTAGASGGAGSTGGVSSKANAGTHQMPVPNEKSGTRTGGQTSNGQLPTAQRSGGQPFGQLSGQLSGRPSGALSGATAASSGNLTRKGGEEGRKPTGSHMSATQQQNVSKLQADMAAIKQGSQVTQEQKDALKGSLTAMADGATKPDPALTQQLASDLSTALSDGSLSKKEQLQLSNDLSAVMNSANIPLSEVNQAIADAQAILAASGVTQATVQTIAADLKAIATEAQKNAGNAQQAAGSSNTPSGRVRQPRLR